MQTSASASGSKQGELDPCATLALRRDLRAATADYVAGKGTLASVHNQIERIGQYLTRNPDASLHDARCSFAELVEASTPSETRRSATSDASTSGEMAMTGLPGWNFEDLYKSVKEARNDLAHTGTEAALAGTRTVALAYVLTEALVKVKNDTPAKHLMVPNPICAHGWQTLADIRRTMLMNDYSVLPLATRCAKNGKWRVVCAERLGRYLMENRKCRLGQELKCCKSSVTRCVDVVLPRKKAECFGRSTSDGNNSTANKDICMPVIVAEDENILGIVTAFDLL